MAQPDSAPPSSTALMIRGTPETEPGPSALRSKMVSVRAEFRPEAARAGRQGPEAEVAAQAIEGAGQVARGVGQRAVEIEQDRVDRKRAHRRAQPSLRKAAK